MREPRIAVVGGGPAGATAARRLSESGARVTLFEARPDAEKPCGGGIPARAVEEFPELADAALPRRVVHRVVIHAPSGATAGIELPDGIHIFSRHALDSVLRRRAVDSGAGLVTARVTGVRRLGSKGGGGRGDGGWSLATAEGETGPFDLLIGADGVQGAVRRAVAPPWQGGELTLALYAYVAGPSQHARVSPEASEMILKFFGDFDGYLWVFPRTDHVSVGICARHRSVDPTRLRDELQRFVEDHYPAWRFPPEALKGYFIPAAHRPAASRSRDAARWALVGDAAGTADPLTREGIAHAMRSAASVARAIAAGRRLRTPPIPLDTLRAHHLGHGFFRRSFLESLVRLARDSPAIREILADLHEGRQPYRSLKARLVGGIFRAAGDVGLKNLIQAARGAGSF